MVPAKCRGLAVSDKGNLVWVFGIMKKDDYIDILKDKTTFRSLRNLQGSLVERRVNPKILSNYKQIKIFKTKRIRVYMVTYHENLNVMKKNI